MLSSQRTHDILTLVKFVRTAKVDSIPNPSSVAVAGFGHTGPLAAAARAVSGDAIDVATIDTGSFRFAKILDYRDPQFLPGGAKYLDLPGLLILGAPHRLWIAGDKSMTELVSGTYEKLGKANEMQVFQADATDKESAAANFINH